MEQQLHMIVQSMALENHTEESKTISMTMCGIQCISMEYFAETDMQPLFALHISRRNCHTAL